MIQGFWSYGNVSAIGFPAQIATDLAGASFSYSGIHQAGGWKRAEGRWVTLPATWYPAFITGANKGITLGGGAPSSSSVYGKFRGYNHPENPKLRVTYTK